MEFFNEEREMILSSVSSKSIKKIFHIGSTAILGICAKNIVDILIEVKDKSKL